MTEVIEYSLSKQGNLPLSTHFRLPEFASGDGSDKVLNAPELVSKLEQMIVRLDAVSCTIISGYRSDKYSVKVGGYAGDRHTKGQAADVQFKRKDGSTISGKEVCCAAQDLGFGGIAYISETSTHLDVRKDGIYRGDERKGSNTVTNDFYTYFGIPKAQTSRLTYQSHVQNIGWLPEVSDNQVSGTVGQSLRMEALIVNLDGVQVEAHVQDIGWQKPVSSGQLAGTEGNSLRLEAVKIWLTGELAKTHDIIYCAHVQNIGWLDWVKNDSDYAGTVGKSLRMEAIRIKLVRK